MNTPIKSSDADAVEQLTEKITNAEKLQALMKNVNATIRSNAAHKVQDQIPSLVNCGLTADQAIKILQPDYAGRIGFAQYQLTNNNANIRRMKQRIEHVQKLQALPEVVQEGSNARFEDCPSENRVKLFFPGKPDATIRANLKSNGFRWAPSTGAWQAYRNYRALRVAKEVAGVNDQRISADELPNDGNRMPEPQDIHDAEDIQDQNAMRAA